MIRNPKRLIPSVALFAAFAAGCQSPMGVPTSTTGPDASAPIETRQLPPPAAAPEAPAAVEAPLEVPAEVAASRLALTAAAPLLASASAAVAGYGAERAVDGNSDQEWKSTGTNPWLILDRGATGPLTALPVKINPNVAYAVAVSDDNATWRTVLTNQKNTTWSLERKALPAGTAGRYVKLSFTTSATVMVFEATPEGTFTSAPTPSATADAPSAVNPTLAASASGEAAGYGAARAVDGDANLEWKSTGTNPWLILDRGASGPLTALPLKTNPNMVFAVAVSDDKLTWRTVLTNQKNTTWSVERKALPAGTAGRYVKLSFTTSATVMVFEATPEGTFAAAASPAPTVAPTAAPTAAPTVAPTAAPTQAPATSYVQTRFGNQSVPRSADGTHTRGYQLISELGMNTIREGWNWANLQPNKGSYVSWLGAYTDPKTTQLASQGLKIEAMVCDTPTWATSDGAAPVKKYTVPAGLKQAIFADGTDVWKVGAKPNPNNYFAVYMFDMATRYKGKVASWQVWNEPDFPTGDLGAGYKGTNGNTRYWTGTVQEYVRLLQVAHTVVKNVDPAARIALGGLGYENYLAAILDNGGAKYFDIVDFHAYGTDKTSANGVLNSSWGFLGRYEAMKKVMTARGVTGKTYAVSETGMTANNPEEQAGYAAKMMATSLGLGDVELAQWAVFTNPGHLNIGLIDKATLTAKTKGYAAYAFTTKQLAGARPAGALTGTNVQGWRFERPDGKSAWLAWSKTASATATLPAMSGRVLDKYGATRVASYAGGSLALTADPVWVMAN